MKDIVVFDLDGVLRHGIDVDEEMVTVAEDLGWVGNSVYIFSPCGEDLREQELAWIDGQDNLPCDQLLMRPDISAEYFHDFKLRMLKDVIPADRVLCIFEDNPMTAEEMALMGFTVCQVRREA